MRLFTALTIYRIILPVLFLAAFPGWIVKMMRRGGFGTNLTERIGIYLLPPEEEPSGAVHIHAVSVGEALLALKLIREWHITDPKQPFVIATGTATGHAVATAAGLTKLRVTYAPLDFRWMIQTYLNRFKPSQIILIEGEVWPNLLLNCKREDIPVRLVNARMSPRSARRFRRFAAWLRPIYQLLETVAIQEPEDAAIWKLLGVAPEKIHATGSLKFDPGSGARPKQRPEFQRIIDSFGSGRKVILAASTHPGEDALIASAIREALPEALIALVPRHAERRNEVSSELENAGFLVRLRSTSDGALPTDDSRHIFVIDSTGELSDWTAHADVVIVGKSFLAIGGQNPCEAILAGKPVIFGPHMENFQPLAARLIAKEGCISVEDPSELPRAIRSALEPGRMIELTHNASSLLIPHQGATQQILSLLDPKKFPIF